MHFLRFLEYLLFSAPHLWLLQLKSMGIASFSIHKIKILRVKGELRCKMNLWSNKTLVPIVNSSLRFVFMIIECKEFYL